MRKRVIITCAVVLVIVAVWTVGWVLGRPTRESLSSVAHTVPYTEPTVAVASVERRSLRDRTSLTGVVTPMSTVTVVSVVPGRVEWLVDEVGIQVEHGAVIARLDDADLRLNLKQAQAVLAQAQAGLDRLKVGAGEEERRQAEASVAQAETGFRLAEESWRRALYLYEQGVISREALDAAHSQFEMAESQLEAARQLLAQVERGALPEELRAAEAQVLQAEVAVEFAEKQLADSVITAPIGGTVAVRHTQPGAMVGAGTPVVTLVAIDDVVVQVGVNDRLVNTLRVGDTVAVTLQAMPGERFDGEVVSISPVVDEQTRLYPVRIRVANPEHRLRPGMMATVHLTRASVDDAFAVPTSAIVQREGNAFMFVVQPDGTVEERRVTVGLAEDGWIQVAPAYEGEIVVTSHHAFLAEGVRVRIERGAR